MPGLPWAGWGNIRPCWQAGWDKSQLRYPLFEECPDEGFRAACRELFADGKWGSREVCHLCVNTTGREIGSLAAALAGYAEHWFSP